MKQVTIVLFLFAFAFGCSKTVTLHPGAVNVFDSNAYDTLLTVQAALETASKEVVNYPNLKPELNHAIDAYNVAMIAYKGYHEAALAGKPTDQASLAAMIKSLSTTVAAVIAKLRPNAPAPAPVPTARMFHVETV